MKSLWSISEKKLAVGLQMTSPRHFPLAAPNDFVNEVIKMTAINPNA